MNTPINCIGMGEVRPALNARNLFVIILFLLISTLSFATPAQMPSGSENVVIYLDEAVSSSADVSTVNLISMIPGYEEVHVSSTLLNGNTEILVNITGFEGDLPANTDLASVTVDFGSYSQSYVLQTTGYGNIIVLEEY